MVHLKSPWFVRGSPSPRDPRFASLNLSQCPEETLITPGDGQVAIAHEHHIELIRARDIEALERLG
jgi:hypothetical protein